MRMGRKYHAFMFRPSWCQPILALLRQEDGDVCPGGQAGTCIRPLILHTLAREPCALWTKNATCSTPAVPGERIAVRVVIGPYVWKCGPFRSFRPLFDSQSYGRTLVLDATPSGTANETFAISTCPWTIRSTNESCCAMQRFLLSGERLSHPSALRMIDNPWGIGGLCKLWSKRLSRNLYHHQT